MTESKTQKLSQAAVPLIKHYFIDSDDDLLSAVEDLSRSGSNSVFSQTEAIAPPFDPMELSRFLEISGSLRTNVDAYAANIDGNGHQYEPIVDLGDESAREVVRQAMYEESLEKSVSELGYEQTAQILLKKISTGEEEEISDEEVDAKIAEIRHQMASELRILERFFGNCCTEMSFAKLRRVTRQDYEVLGNAFWEVIRRDDEPQQINLVSGATVRLLPRLPPIEVERPMVHSVLRTEATTQIRSFRTYVQILRRGPGTNSSCRYFKQYGDPRVFSAKTGKVYDTEEDLKAKEPKSLPATELLHFKIHSSRTPYGVPRWISEVVNVLGCRHAEQVNLMYFENKSVPPLAILVSGGSLAAESVTRVRDYIKNEIRGAKNFHKILILEAESGNTIDPTVSGHVRIEIKPLAQQQDGMFMEYIDKCRDSLGMVFRNPRIVRGDTRDFNKSTSESALLFTEQQVYAPERKDFDWLMNKEILPQLGVRLWRFASKGPDVTDPGEMNKMLVEAAKEGFLSLAELRRAAEKVYGPLPIFRSWTNEVPLFVLRQHQQSLKFGGIAGFEEEMGAPAPRVTADEQKQQSEGEDPEDPEDDDEEDDQDEPGNG